MKPQRAEAASEKREFAYEIKFLISEEAAKEALAWMRAHLVPDPFAGGATHDAYCVNSVYLDTPEFAVYHRIGSFGRCKYRVRRYGREDGVFLERKLKTRGLVGKRRTRVQDAEVAFLADDEPSADWIGFWFHRRLLVRNLEPKCQIAYDRIARVGSSPEGTLRMTLDRNLRAFPTSEWSVKESGTWTPLLDKQCIIELKYRKSFPELYQGLVDSLGLKPQPVSKYRMTVSKFGWGGPAASEAAIPLNGHTLPHLSADLSPRNSLPSGGTFASG